MNALHSLGVVASQHGDHAEALRHFRQALALKPDFEAAARNIAHALLMLGRPEEAANASADALAIGETPEAKLLFVQALSLSQDAARIAPSRAMIVRALSERWARPADLARIAAQVLVVSGTLAKGNKASRSAAAGAPDRGPGLHAGA